MINIHSSIATNIQTDVCQVASKIILPLKYLQYSFKFLSHKWGQVTTIVQQNIKYKTIEMDGANDKIASVSSKSFLVAGAFTNISDNKHSNVN